MDDSDPAAISEQVYNRTLHDMKEDLLRAINERKAKVLGLALEIFNKVQEQAISNVKLDDVGRDNAPVNADKINETLQKYQLLLTDTRSPLYSALRLMGKPNELDIFEMSS